MDSFHGMRERRGFKEGNALIMLSEWNRTCIYPITEMHYQVSIIKCIALRLFLAYLLNWTTDIKFSWILSFWLFWVRILSWYVLGSILKCYQHIRQLNYSDEPDYALLKSYVSHDLGMMSPALKGVFDWSERSLLKLTLVAQVAMGTGHISYN